MGAGAVTGRIVELRVHGVSGTAPEAMLADPHPQQVSGDADGRVFRRAGVVGSVLLPLALQPSRSGSANTTDRIVEAFHWGRFTSGSASRALWLLLLPFTLVNLARFALLLPHRDVDRRWYHKLTEGLLRLLGLILTVSLVTTVSYLAFDVLASQCGGQERCVRSAPWLGWFVDRPLGVRFAVASLLPGATLLLVGLFGRANFLYAPPGSQGPWRTSTGSFDDAHFWRGSRTAATQRAAHVAAGTGVLGLLALLAPGSLADQLADGRGPDEVLYLALLLICCAGLVVAIAVVAMDPAPRRTTDVDGVRSLPWVHAVRVVVAFGAVASVVWSAFHLQKPPAGQVPVLAAFEVAANVTAVLIALWLLGLLLLTAATAFLSTSGRRIRGRDGSVPKAFRPFWGGMGAWMLAALAAVFASGFGTAAVFWVTDVLGTAQFTVVAPDAAAPAVTGDELEIQIGASYWIGALLWGALAAFAAVAVLPLVAWLLGKTRVTAVVSVLVIGSGGVATGAAWVYDGDDLLDDQGWWFFLAAALVLAAVGVCVWAARSGRFAELVAQDYTRDAGDERGRAAIARRWRITNSRYRYHHALGLLTLIGALLIGGGGVMAAWLVAAAPTSAEGQPREWLADAANSWFGALGVSVVSGIAVALVGLGVATWRTPSLRTTVGILWDIVSFWPRLTHPLCPPPYGGRAVLGVAQRAEQLKDLGARAIVLSGHSQGSVITVGAAAIIGEQARQGTPGICAGPQSAADTRDRLAMLTYGSQLQFIYARMFPTYLGFRRLHWIYAHVLGGRWQNLYRWTDPLGGPVLSWPVARKGPARFGPGVGAWTSMSCSRPANCSTPGAQACRWYQPVCAQAALPECPGHGPLCMVSIASDGVSSWWCRIGPDLRLRDPDVIVENAHRPRSPLRAHSAYPDDPVFDLVVVELAAAVAARG